MPWKVYILFVAVAALNGGDGNSTCKDSTSVVNFRAHHQYQMYDDKNYEVVATLITRVLYSHSRIVTRTKIRCV